jgi:hypothetical protein
MIQHYHNMHPTAKIPLYRDLPSLVSLPSMLQRVPEGKFIPVPVDTTIFKPSAKPKSNEIRVGY